jgi:hypothetical protein
VAAASPSRAARLYLVDGHQVVAVDARGVIPSLEKALGDPEIARLDAWHDAPSDAAWSAPDPASVLRVMDRFHAIPDVPERAGSWAEWLYFNGSAGDVKLYLSLIVGPEGPPGARTARVRLQLERGGRRTDYSTTAVLPAAEVLASAPDFRVGDTTVRLEGLVYRIEPSLFRETGGAPARPSRGTPDVTGEITLQTTPGRSLPPFSISGARGWVSGYVVPVLSGSLGGTLRVEGETVRLDGGTGYHDHNWGFWEGVTWQWGQVAGDGLSVVYGRIRPPADAADPERVPGFMMVLGPDGPVGFSANVSIREEEDPLAGRPRRIAVEGRGEEIDLRMTIEIEDAAVRTRIGDGPSAVDFLQMRGTYRVTGRAGGREIDFSAGGAAETFRGGPEGTATTAPRPAW